MRNQAARYLSSPVAHLAGITAGSAIYAFAIKAIAIEHQFLTGGIYGVGLLINYTTGLYNPWVWYMLINIPIFLAAWKMVSRRFFLYSLYGVACVTGFSQVIDVVVPIHDPMLAAIASGVVYGSGVGLTLRSMGSSGGMDVVAVILNQRFNFRIGTVGLMFNALLFSCGLAGLDIDRVLFSLVLVFVGAFTIEHVQSLFNQRKAVLIISERIEEISDNILSQLRRGGTYLHGHGAYTGTPKKVLLTVVHNYQLKRLEEAVFSVDPKAFMIIENTFNVLGWGFSRRKIY